MSIVVNDGTWDKCFGEPNIYSLKLDLSICTIYAQDDSENGTTAKWRTFWCITDKRKLLQTDALIGARTFFVGFMSHLSFETDATVVSVASFKCKNGR